MEGKSNQSLLGHLAAFLCYLIFGFNIVACREIALSGLVTPLCLFCFRALGAALLFWIFSFFIKPEQVDRKDLKKIFLASMLGLFLTQMTFLVAIKMTTPMDTAVVASLTPVFTMFMAAIFIKEPITAKKVVGVMISFAGVVFLIYNSVYASNGVTSSSLLGIFLIVLNALFFSSYLGIFRPVIVKYSAVTFMKWMFTFSAAVSLPLGMIDLVSLPYGEFSTRVTLLIAGVVFFSTFVAYLLVSYAQKQIRPTLVSLYSYVQPIVASGLSIYLGMDVLTWKKVLAAILVFTGVAIVNRSKAKK